MNSIFCISPYKSADGQWMFDDPTKGLEREPFVAGTDDIIESLAGEYDHVLLLFSDNPFPNHNLLLLKENEYSGGHWYYSGELDKRGWLCPALLKYFKYAPDEIYVQFIVGR
jgi:hypothetical protein